MNTPLAPSRLIFAAVCAIGILLIGYGAALEISRQKRGTTLVSARQYRARMISAVIWITILLSMSYAVTSLWPVATYTAAGKLTEQSREQVKHFGFVFFGSFALMLVGLFLFFMDLRYTARERQAIEAKRQAEFVELTRAAASSSKAAAQSPGEAPPTI